MTAIDIFPWDENFNTGIELIDSQHQRLVLLINRLAREVAFGCDALELYKIFDELVEYTNYHFTSEEAIWKEYLAGEEMEREHIDIHAGFVDVVLKSRENISHEGAEEMLKYLTMWLASHILETDRYLARVVLYIQDGLEMKEAKTRASVDMGGLMRKLIDLILSVYGMLSSNTLRLMMEIRDNEQKIEENIAAQNEILESKNLLITIIDTLPVRVFWKDTNLNYMGCNKIFAKDAGYDDASSLVGRDDYEMVWKNEADIYRADDSFVMQNDVQKLLYEEPQTTPDGKIIWVNTSKAPIKNNKNEIIGIVGTYEDITKKKEAELKLKLAASVFSNAKEGIMITSTDGTIVDVNDAFEEITGYTKEQAIGKNPSFLKSQRYQGEFFTNMWSLLLRDGFWQGEIWNTRADGNEYAQMMTISDIKNEKGDVKNYIALFSDITAIKEHEKELERIAHYDALTGLANRVLLEDRLNQAMIGAVRYGGFVAVVYIDLDGFKEVNDLYGHEMGDKLLQVISKDMRDGLREGDTLARLGGDEFVAVLTNLNGSSESILTLERLLRIASKGVEIDGALLKVSASVGVSFYPQENEIGSDGLLRQADQAMYRAKQEGKNQFKFFDHTQEQSVKEQYRSILQIKQALENGEFELFYQPKVNMRTAQMVGAEALIRWRHPQKGLLLPAAFLPLIEHTSTEILMGEWVIESAMRQMESWSREGFSLKVSVNVGSYQLERSDFVERLKVILDRFSPKLRDFLEIELLETSALVDIGKMALVMDKCKKMGIEFSLDDFGSGYASLAWLKNLPVATLKIDQEFVRDMLHNSQDLAILEGVIALGGAFRKEVIAEGVESVEQGRFLLQLGCELAQGYAIARPMEASKLMTWKSEWKSSDEWSGCSLIANSRLQLLYAMVEHRSWVGAIEAFVDNANDSFPPLDSQLCRFGEWLSSKQARECVGDEFFEKIDALHETIHECGVEIVAAKNSGDMSTARAKLAKLKESKDKLTAVLVSLLNTH